MKIKCLMLLRSAAGRGCSWVDAVPHRSTPITMQYAAKRPWFVGGTPNMTAPWSDSAGSTAQDISAQSRGKAHSPAYYYPQGKSQVKEPSFSNGTPQRGGAACDRSDIFGPAQSQTRLLFSKRSGSSPAAEMPEEPLVA